MSTTTTIIIIIIFKIQDPVPSDSRSSYFLVGHPMSLYPLVYKINALNYPVWMHF